MCPRGACLRSPISTKDNRMTTTGSRWSCGLSRAGLVLSLTVVALAGAPRPASALALVCIGGNCFVVEGGCEGFNTLASSSLGPRCFVLGPIALRNPRLIRDGSGGASFVNDGKTNAIMADANAAILQQWTERRRREGAERPVTEADRRLVNEAFQSTDRRVSDQRLEALSRELRLPIEVNFKVTNEHEKRVDGPAGVGPDLGDPSKKKDYDWDEAVGDLKNKKDKDWDEAVGDRKPAVIEGVRPTNGPTQGGTLLTLTGTNLSNTREVNWGGRMIPVRSSTESEIVVVVPEGEGTVEATTTPTNGVGGQGGGRYTFKPTSFMYNPPQLEGISPASGPAGGGTLVTITGSNFGLNPTVKFGDQVAVIRERSHTRLVVVSPSVVMSPNDGDSALDVWITVIVAGPRTPSKFPPGSSSGNFTYRRR